MDSFAGLLNNAALMLVLCVFYDTFNLYSIQKETIKNYCTGILVGITAIIVMLNPWFIQPGVFFDTRWVLLSLSGLFFGFKPTLIAVVIAGSFRLYQGGPGGIVGTVVIITTASVGVAWRYYHNNKKTNLNCIELYLFGVAVQLAMLSCMLLMPAEMRIPILKAIGLPILTIYPVLTLLVGLILKRQEERRASELELAHSRLILQRERGLLRGVINSIQDSIYFKDTKDRYLGCNQAFSQLTGVDEQEILGKDDTELFDNNTANFLNDQENLVTAFKKPTTKEEWFSFKKGDNRLFNIKKTPFTDSEKTVHGYVGIIRDNTTQYISEKALRASEAKFSKAFKIAPIIISISSIEDGRYIEINDTFLNKTGYNRDDVIGKKSVDIGFIDQKSRNIIKNEILEKGSIHNLELTLRKADGSNMLCIYSGEIIEVDEEKRLLSIATDITELNKLQEDLAHARKMESIGTLAGGVAHDFNNLLSIILGNSELAQDEISKENVANKYLNNISFAAKKAAKVIDQILTFSRRNKDKLSPLNLSEVITEELDLIKSSAQPNIKIVTNIKDTCGSIYGEATQIHQLLINLTTNAVQAMSKTGGTLTIGLKQCIPSTMQIEPFSEGQCPIGEYICLSISDTGKGIDKSIQDRIFEPYFTTKGIGQGSGLGLAVVHGIVKHHNGFIQVKSSPQGTTFLIFFPIFDHLLPEDTLQANAIHMVEGKGSILLVDDEPDIVEIMQHHLKRSGYEVFSCNSGEQALDFLEKNKNIQSIDLVITDHLMPGMTGAQLTEKILEKKSDLPVIICSGYSADFATEDLTKLGAKAFLNKPVSRTELVETAHKAICKQL